MLPGATASCYNIFVRDWRKNHGFEAPLLNNCVLFSVTFINKSFLQHCTPIYSQKLILFCYNNGGDSVVLSMGCYTSSIYSILLCASINLLTNELNKLHDYNCNTDSLMVNFQRFKPAKYHTPSPDPNSRQVIAIYITKSTQAFQYKPSNCTVHSSDCCDVSPPPNHDILGTWTLTSNKK